MDDLGKAIPASEALVDAEQGTQSKPVNEFCLNCGTPLLDKFCHHCGQKDLPARQTLGELWTNFISSFWSYEGKFFQTTKYILTKPGFLAVEYIQGKRETYYHPARMYVFMSFVFFLLFFSLPDPDDEDTTKTVKTDLTKADSVDVENALQVADNFVNQGALDSVLKDAQLDSADRAQLDSAKSQVLRELKKGNRQKNGISFSKEKKNAISFTGEKYKTKEAYDSAQLTKPELERDNWFERIMNLKAIEINQHYKDKEDQFQEEFKKAFLENFSKVLFWLLPFFALVLKLLYVRRDYFYSEHLVFSIYYYNFFYLAGSLKMLVEQISWLDWLGTIMGFWIFFYLLFAMKRMYWQGWGKTILKFFIFSMAFSVLLSIGVSIMAISLLLSF